MRVFLLLFLACTSLLATAQSAEDVSAKPVTLEFKDAPLRDVLRAAFRQVNVPYAIQPHLDGKVTLSVKDGPFIHALRDVMLQVDGIYFIDSGIYHFRPLTSRIPPLSPPLEGGTGLVPRGIRIYSGPDTIPFVDHPLGQSDLQLLLKEMFAIAKKDYWIDRTLHGLVRTPGNYGTDLEGALSILAKEVGARWYKEGETYVFRRKWGPLK